jgi:hypothetical protein
MRARELKLDFVLVRLGAIPKLQHSGGT